MDERELPSDREAIARWLRELREEAGISRAELGRILGVDRQQINRWLNAKSEPSGSHLMLLLNALGVHWTYSPDYLPRAVNTELQDLRAAVTRVLDATSEQAAEVVARLSEGAGPPVEPVPPPPGATRPSEEASR